MIEIYDALNRGEVDRVTVMRAGKRRLIINKDDLKREFLNVYISLTNALFDGYRVCLRCDKEIQFADLSTGQSRPYPGWSKPFALTLGVCGLTAGLASTACCIWMPLGARPNSMFTP